METLIATTGNLINVLPAPLKALTARGGFENQTHQAASSDRLVHEPLCCLSFVKSSHLQLQSGIWPHHLMHLASHWALSWKPSQPRIFPFYFSFFLSARSMCVCLVVIDFVMLSIFWAGWVVVSTGCRVPRGSEQFEYTPKII